MDKSGKARVGTKVRDQPKLDSDFLKKPTGWPFKEPHDFMKGKRVDDGIPRHLHRVHDKVYDLRHFDHPGGKLWLDLTVGTDITELFETHHVNYNKATKMMSVYEVRHSVVLPPRNSALTFSRDGFYATLRAKVWEYHRDLVGLGPSNLSVVFADTLVIISICLTIAAGMYAGSDMKIALILTVAVGTLNGLFIGIGHNFMHQRKNFRRHYLDLSGFSSAEFRMHHALSHHPYTNTVMDAEINSLLPTVSFFPHRKTVRDKFLAGVGLTLICNLGIPIKQIQRLSRIVMGTWPYDVEDKIAQLIPVLQLVFLTNFSLQLGPSLFSGLALWLVMLTVSSMVFLWGNFLSGPHFNDECWHQGDVLDSTDWGILQVQTSVERSELSAADNVVANLFNIPTFNHHHLHHLFPTIDAVHLSKLLPLFAQHCEEHKVVFRKMSNASLARGLWRCIIGAYDEPNLRTRNGIFLPKE